MELSTSRIHESNVKTVNSRHSAFNVVFFSKIFVKIILLLFVYLLILINVFIIIIYFILFIYFYISLPRGGMCWVGFKFVLLLFVLYYCSTK